MKKRIYLFLWIIVFTTFSIEKINCQSFGNFILVPVKDIQNDLKFLKKSLEKYHPNHVYYSSKSRFNFVYDSLYKSVDKPLSYEDTFVKLQTLMAAVKDGHTGIDFYLHKKQYLYDYRYLPFFTQIINNEIINVFNGVNDLKIKKGAKILEINGLSAKALMENVNKIAAADNDNLPWKHYLFSHLINLVLKSHEFVNIKYQNFGETKINETKIQLISSNDYYYKIANIFPESKYNTNYKLSKVDSLPNTFILKIKSWTYDDVSSENKNLTKYLNNTFSKLKQNNTQNLIIDLRNNNGGYVGLLNKLLSYIMPSDGNSFEKLATNKRIFRKLSLKGNLLNTLYIKRGDKLRYKKNTNGLGFTGKIYVINNGGGYSATCVFNSVLKNRDKTYFINSPTGGAAWGGFAVFFLNDYLPNTKFRYSIPLYQYWNIKSKKEDKKFLIEPDIPIQITREDIVANENWDKEMSKILKEIKHHLKTKN